MSSLGLLRFEPALQEETLTSFLKSLHWGLKGRVGGIGQPWFPVRADRPEVAHFTGFSGTGVDRVGLDSLTLPMRLRSIWDSAPSLLSSDRLLLFYNTLGR